MIMQPFDKPLPHTQKIIRKLYLLELQTNHNRRLNHGNLRLNLLWAFYLTNRLQRSCIGQLTVLKSCFCECYETVLIRLSLNHIAWSFASLTLLQRFLWLKRMCCASFQMPFLVSSLWHSWAETPNRPCNSHLVLL